MQKTLAVAAVLFIGLVGCISGGPVERPVRAEPRRPSLPKSPAAREPHLSTRATSPGNRARTWHPRGRRISPRWTTIVIHHSATKQGGARAFDRYHQEHNGWDELGYHFVIGNGTNTPNGAIEVGSRWHKQKHGAHCKTPGNFYNEHGIGICLVGDFTKTRPTDKQLDSLRDLVQFLIDACGVRPESVTTHRAVAGNTTRCPGSNFSLRALRATLSSHVTNAAWPRHRR